MLFVYFFSAKVSRYLVVIIIIIVVVVVVIVVIIVVIIVRVIIIVIIHPAVILVIIAVVVIIAVIAGIIVAVVIIAVVVVVPVIVFAVPVIGVAAVVLIIGDNIAVGVGRGLGGLLDDIAVSVGRGLGCGLHGSNAGNIARHLVLAAGGNVQRTVDVARIVRVELAGDDRLRRADFVVDILCDTDFDFDFALIVERDLRGIGDVKADDAGELVIAQALCYILQQLGYRRVLKGKIGADLSGSDAAAGQDPRR